MHFVRAAAKHIQDPRLPPSLFASPSRICAAAALAAVLSLAACVLHAQQAPTSLAARRAHTHDFLAQRTSANLPAAVALNRARKQHAALLEKAHAHPLAGSPLNAAWSPLGPTSIVSATYNNLSGRITALALDPNDTTGNTLYVGTTGGGVWKTSTATNPSGAVLFAPLTDTLPVFSQNAGGSTIASLSIGSLAVQRAANPVLLAGTGDPNDATDSYYGEGILRSTDGGLTWTLAQYSHDGANGNHSFIGLSVAGLAFSSATPSLVVAALATSPQAEIVNATVTGSVPGLYFSADAGVTWQMATIYDGTTIVQQPTATGTVQPGNAVTSVAWDAQRSEFFAAVRAHGYYASPDGMTWTRLAVQPGGNLTTANCPVGSEGTGSPTCPILRGTLAVQPATGDLYALTVDASDLDQGLWQDLCNAAGNSCTTPAPTFANRIDNGALEVGSGSTAIEQGDYNLTLAAAPAAGNSTVLFAGTIDLYRCDLSAGSSMCSLRNTTNAINGCDAPAQVAPAQHALAAFAQTTAPLLFLGNDGGLWSSPDGVAETGPACSATDASHFENLNVAIGSLAEVTGFAEDPGIAGILIAGLGANGSAATATAATLTAWPQLSAGEGGLPSIDQNNDANWLVAIGAGVNLKQCPDGSGCDAADFINSATIGEAQVDYDATVLDAPTLLDPALTANVLVGTCRVWRGAASGTSWTDANAISPAFNGSATPCTASSPLIRSLAAGGPVFTATNAQSSGSTVLYAGLAGALDGGGNLPGAVFVTTTANTASSATPWTNIALSPVTNDVSNNYVFNPFGFDVSTLTADPHDATGATVYATIMGFGAEAAPSPHFYRSTDFGAHWRNLTDNLPDAPANAVLVDPNDANTVYVALDTGVYVTQQVSTCGNEDCWSVYGTALPNSPVTALAGSAALPTGDGRIGMLRASTYGRGIWQTPLLTAVVPANPAIPIAPTSLTFAAQQVGTQSAAQTVTITSSGTSPVTFGTPAITGDFAETDTCSGQALAVGANCEYAITFAPTAVGTRSGLLTVYANISGGQATVALTGTGTAPAAIVLTPLSLSFSAIIVNQTSAAQSITISNTGGTSATLQTPVIIGDFAISANTCGATLPPSTGCTVEITFTPTASGTRTGTLSITDSAGTQTAQLSGTGDAPATDTLSPASLNFGQQQVTTASAPQQVTITNAGDVALTLLSATVSPGDFAVVNGCGTSLAAKSTCALSVAFVPSATGTRSATLTFSDAIRTQTVALTGVGVAPPGVSLTPMSLSFANTGVGLSSPAQTVTLTNNGGLALDISNVAISPGFTLASKTCGATLAVSAACTMTIVFTPIVPGPISGALTLTDNAASAAQTVNLTGTGIDFMLTANGPTSVTVSGSESAAYPLLLSSVSTITGNVSFACTGAPAHSACTVAPATAALGSTVSLTATIEIGLLKGALGPSPSPWRTRGERIVLALGMPLLLAFRKRKHASLLRVFVFAFVFSLLSVSGCGSGRKLPDSGTDSGPGSTPTPSGTYNITVTGTTAGISHSVALTLIVP